MFAPRGKVQDDPVVGCARLVFPVIVLIFEVVAWIM
jgi:hypothetical protein